CLPQWFAGHFQVQLPATVGVARDELLVELDAETGLRRRDHVPRLPTDGFDEHIGMKPLPALDTLEYEEVRAAGGELDVGGAHDRPAIQVWRELHMVHLGERCDLLRLEDPPDAPQVHLQDGRAPDAQQAREIVLGGEARATSIPIATGERLATKYDFARLL